ncbi:helix-turn-helix transcriptional regulator [Kitasatospora sp. A2-31]|uniref:helix-turn-helix transcriptional regulator n=1 Tax=Kitasatospora sp. A2-31 TaxID=2916414 RepID=UPI001EEEF5AE|nr:helix-turn-helix transcriptional regulator [Kitasatospora sp. A2-31]MCG6499418.1 helix-turn-helix domain-containing protein [Kitasatospora sp. A2-31]
MSERDPDWAELGHEIRAERTARKLSQQQLADLTGLDRKTISHYERGRRPAPGRIPDGYYAVARYFGWARGVVEDLLCGRRPLGDAAAESAEVPEAARPNVFGALSGPGASPAELFPAVGRFARAAVAAGGDPALRDLLEDVADRLLQSVPQGGAARSAAQSTFGLAAYRPHGWDEGDPGVPEDDQERIRQALEEYTRNQQRP